MKKLVVIGLLLNLLWFGLIVYGVTVLVEYVSHHGLKSVADQVWNGDGK